MKRCECSCGQSVAPGRRFIKGHNRRKDHPLFKGGTTHQGAVMVYAPEHPRRNQRNYVCRSRLVIEEQLGRYLEPEEIVWHIDSDRANDEPENLEVITRSELMRRIRAQRQTT